MIGALSDLEFWVSTGLSLAAFVVAIGALYASNLKRAEIRLVAIPETLTRLGGSGWGGVSAFEPSDIKATMSVLAYNSGARGGVLVGVEASFLDADQVPFDAARTTTLGEDGAPTPLPLVLGAGQSVPMTVEVRLRLALAEVRPGEVRLRELIRRMEELKSVEVALNYRYVKGFSLFPSRRGDPITSHGVLTVGMDLEWIQTCRERLEELLRKRTEGVLNE